MADDELDAPELDIPETGVDDELGLGDETLEDEVPDPAFPPEDEE